LHGAPESFQGAVAAGLLGVGDRYAGTASECGAVLERIVATAKSGRKAQAVAEVGAYRQRRRAVPGFGHPVHQQVDPRVDRLLDIATDAGVSGGYISAMRLLESTVREISGKPLVTNISAAIAAVLGEAGIPSPLMRGIVLTARCAGLVGHLLEEMENPVAHEMWQAAQATIDYQG
jgi:citrate synthase